MPNNQPPAKTRIDERANKALADLKKVTDAHPELDLNLKSVKDSLEKIATDPHHAQ
jgi:hypothetical protein